MNKYSLLMRFHHDHRLQFDMYAFVYIDPYTIPVLDCFPSTKTFVDNYNKNSTPGPVPKHWLGFSYIRS